MFKDKELSQRVSTLEYDTARRANSQWEAIIPLSKEVTLIKNILLDSAAPYGNLSRLVEDLLNVTGCTPGKTGYELMKLSMTRKIENYINSQPRGEN